MVRFEREGVVRVPHRYLAAGHLEHGYARTTYGVQGATHDVARYHPTDVSSFEEGYVAITRARNAARIYVVDGNLPEPDDDLTHAPPEPRPFGMTEIADALARRRSGHMAADAAGPLSEVAATLNGQTLRELTERRRHLARVLADAPPAVDQVIDDTQRTIDSLRARRNAWNDTLRAEPTDESTPARAASAIAHLDRALAKQERRLDAARRQQSDRREWNADNADVVAEHDLVARAERARETQVRAAAIHEPSASWIRIIGPEPSLQRDRHAWRRAVETTAIYRDRHGTSLPEGDDIAAVLGPRPQDPLAAADYAQVARMIADAQGVDHTAETAGGPEL